jgi:Domain of unknown function (DUF4082)
MPRSIWALTLLLTISAPCVAETSASSSLWDGSRPPAAVTASDSKSVELGVKFRANVNGLVTSLRFFKERPNTGTHVGHLWTGNGTLLATATFVGESSSGWQEVKLSRPVAIMAGVTYIASYHAPRGRYSFTQGYFNKPRSSGPLTAPASGAIGGNGVYCYGASGCFPIQSHQQSNYWIDIVFEVSNQPPLATDDGDFSPRLMGGSSCSPRTCWPTTPTPRAEP